MNFEMDPSSYGWLGGTGPSALVALSSRVRIARNLSGYRFPYYADDAMRKEILDNIANVVKSEDSLKDFELVELEKLSPLDHQIMVESHIASPYLIQNPKSRALLLDRLSTTAVMINEEDHLRLQCIVSGFDLERAWLILNQLDDVFESRLPYAFHETWGYLTACPTNLGTGLRASALLHLPALVFMQVMQNLIHALNQTGIIVRGFYGEGTEAQGHFFQISNAFTLGPTEENIVSRISSMAGQVMNQELDARERLKKEHGRHIEDRVWRSFAILKSARVINSAEAMEHLSLTRLGVQLGMLPSIPVGLLNELVVTIGPAGLQKKLGVEPDALKRDVLRAGYLRKKLENFS